MTHHVIPFGKYKDQPIEALAEDKPYLDWVLAQSWFKTRYPDLFTIVINNFQEPTETPEHNAMQVRFLDDDYVMSQISRALPDLSDWKLESKSFETEAGWDLVAQICSHTSGERKDVSAWLVNLDIDLTSVKSKLDDVRDELRYGGRALDDATREVDIALNMFLRQNNFAEYEQARLKREAIKNDFFASKQSDFNTLQGQYDSLRDQIETLEQCVTYKFCFFELKPTVSDNFPSVLRQIKAARKQSKPGIVILFVGTYNGLGATQEQFVSFMANEDIHVIFAE